MFETIVQQQSPSLHERVREMWRQAKGPLLRDIAQLTVDQAKNRLETTKRSPDGAAWPPRTSGGEHPLMLRTRKMLGSVRKRRKSATEYLAGAAIEYAKFHHDDAKTPREFIGIGSQDEREIEKLISKFVEDHF